MYTKNFLKTGAIMLILLISISMITMVTQGTPQEYFFTLNLVVPYLGPGAELDKATLFADDLAEIGIKVEIQQIDKPVYYERVWGVAGYNLTWEEGGWDMDVGRFSWRPTGAMWWEGCWASSGLPPGGWNYFGWRNGIADEALHKGWTTVDFDERLELYETFLWEFYRDPPAMSEYWPLMPMPVSTRYDAKATALNWGMTEEDWEINPYMWYWRDASLLAPYWVVTGFEPGETRTLVFAQGTDPTNILPIFHSSGDDFNYGMTEPLIYEKGYDLVEKRPMIMPWLAKNWTWAEDGLAITFYLRDDVYWHDGVKLTADDVKWTIDTILDEDTMAAAHADYDALIKSTTVINPTTIKLDLKAPAPDLLTVLMGPWGGPISPKHILEAVPHGELKEHWYNSEGPTTAHPEYVGNGPFKLVEWKKGEYLKFEAWPDWWGWAAMGDGEPTVDEVFVKIIPEATTALAALEAGEIDGMHEYLVLPVVTEVPAVAERAGNVNSYDYTMMAIRFIGFNLNHPILSNRFVRLAISHAHNNQKVIDDILLGMGIPATGMIPNTHVLYPKNPPPTWEYDVELAKEYMEKAGYKYEYLEPAVIPLETYVIPAVIGLVVGVIVGVVVGRVTKRKP